MARTGVKRSVIKSELSELKKRRRNEYNICSFSMSKFGLLLEDTQECKLYIVRQCMKAVADLIYHSNCIHMFQQSLDDSVQILIKNKFSIYVLPLQLHYFPFYNLHSVSVMDMS